MGEFLRSNFDSIYEVTNCIFGFVAPPISILKVRMDSLTKDVQGNRCKGEGEMEVLRKTLPRMKKVRFHLWGNFYAKIMIRSLRLKGDGLAGVDYLCWI